MWFPRRLKSFIKKAFANRIPYIPQIIEMEVVLSPSAYAFAIARGFLQFSLTS